MPAAECGPCGPGPVKAGHRPRLRRLSALTGPAARPSLLPIISTLSQKMVQLVAANEGSNRVPVWHASFRYAHSARHRANRVHAAAAVRDDRAGGHRPLSWGGLNLADAQRAKA